jgi:DNA-binding CsgD family transcriptional regulator
MKLDEPDVRAMVRLIGEVAALPGGPARRKRALMEGLCKLIGADSWVWGLSCRRDPTQSEVNVSIMNGGFTDDSFARFLQALEHPEMVSFASKFYTELKEKNAHLTRRRDQVTDDAVFERSAAFALWKAADIGSLILSHRPLDDRSASALGFYRRVARPKFTERESRIAHIVLTEVAWLHEQGWPEDRGVQVPALSKRERLTLNLLTSGASHKVIAAQMGISPHTLRDHIKVIYRHFGVHSHAELLHRFFQGNGMDGGN